MDDFPLCDDCEREYTDVKNRRYHAQPVCCPKCGPVHTFEKPDFSADTSDASKRLFLAAGSDALKAAARAIDDGFIVALKGDGGFHLVCDAFSEKAASELRKRLGRPAQPFAVMVRNMKTAKRNAQIREEEGKECSFLENVRRPIVVCNKSPSYELAPSVVPKLHNVGMMLPYSGTHYVLFEHLKTDVVVMTSANLPGLPMVIENDDAFEKLSKIADYFLFHNRLIQNRTDDTVIRFVHEKPVFLRRSRGFVPERILLPFSNPAGVAGVAGVGAEMNNTVSFAKDGNIYLSQYIGNTKHQKTAEYHTEAFETLESLTGISPSVLACDMHPAFNTTKFAEEYVAVDPTAADKQSRLALHRIQHHHAHICSVMADNGLPLDSEVIGIALDGVGYGDDETVWGGEILKCTYADYARLSSLAPQPMAGGDLATRFPSRLVFGMLYPYLENGSISEEQVLNSDLYFPHGETEKKIVLSQLRNNFNVAVTTSAGRVLDAAAVLLGLCRERTYDGEPSMNLEAAAYEGLAELETTSRTSDLLYLEPSFKEVKEKNGAVREVLDTSSLLYSLYLEVSAGESSRFSTNQLAVMFVHALSVGIGRMVLKHVRETGITTVCISGGVANNDYIVSVIASFLKENGIGNEIGNGIGNEIGNEIGNGKENGINLLTHKNLPPGDGCISHGQVAAVTARLLSSSFKNPDAE